MGQHTQSIIIQEPDSFPVVIVFGVTIQCMRIRPVPYILVSVFLSSQSYVESVFFSLILLF